MIKKALILAAGRGKRMEELTLHKPKPLLEVHGKALIVWQIERLKAAGITDIVINTAYLGQQICDFLGNGVNFGVKIIYSREELAGFPEGLETAGGIIKALPLLDEAFLVINADLWSDFSLQPLIKRYQNEDACLVLVNNPDWKESGDFSLQGDYVLLGDSLTFAGISILHSRLFAGLPIDFLKLAPILRTAIKRNQVTGLHYQGLWEDVGTPERLARVQHDRISAF